MSNRRAGAASGHVRRALGRAPDVLPPWGPRMLIGARADDLATAGERRPVEARDAAPWEPRS